MSTQTDTAASDERKSSLRIGKQAFITAALIIFALMIVAGVLTLTVRPGAYERFEEDGRTMIVPGSFSYTEAPNYPVWRWFTAPFEVFAAPGNITLITIVIFIIFISGAFTILEKAGVIDYLLRSIVKRFREQKYRLMAVVIFLFMFLAAFLGIYEAMVPLVVFIVPLALSLGWDSLTGLGMSLLPLAFGFSAAVTNPFTIGVAQTIAELPLFSGAWLRLIFFGVIFLLVFLFVSRHAKKVEKKPELSLTFAEDQRIRANLETVTVIEKEGLGKEDGKNDAKLKRSAIFFGTAMALAILFILVTSRMPAVSDLAFPVMALLFFIGGVGGGALAGMGPRRITSTFLGGAAGMLPGILLLAMAYSVQYIIDQGGITDTILYSASNVIADAPSAAAAFLIYLLTLGMNFFIGSASAKAFLMMPILTPLADLVGISRQTAVLAFDFGDGFSNMLYPSNALLLIALSFTVVTYPKWFRWTIPVQGLILLISSAFLLFAVFISYGPF